MQDRRADQPLADDADATWTAGARVLLVEDHLLEKRRVTAAVLVREREARPAGGAEGALPGETLLEQGVLVAGTSPPAHDRELAGELVGQPLARLGPERIVLGSKIESHARGGSR